MKAQCLNKKANQKQVSRNIGLLFFTLKIKLNMLKEIHPLEYARLMKRIFNCCGFNGFDPKTVTNENWVKIRNEFLKDVSYNGGNTHADIIEVLIWFNKFNKAS